MRRYIARRFATTILVLFLVSWVTFGLILLIPGDPAVAILGEHAPKEDLARVRQELGVDRPIVHQYARWLSRVVRGDLGVSWISRHPVATLLRQSAMPTVQLAFGALVLALVIALPAGVFAAFKENSWWDFVLTSVSIAGAAMPHFWLGILLILLFGLTLGWFPPSGYTPLDRGLLLNLKSITLPALTLSVGLAAIVARQTRSSLLDIIRQEYVRTARAKGLPEHTVIWKHTVRNGLIPIITVTGLQIGRLMSGAVVTETIFSIPGVGRLMVDAVLSRDWPIVQVTMLFAAGLVLSANLLVDITYALADPRIRYE